MMWSESDGEWHFTVACCLHVIVKRSAVMEFGRGKAYGKKMWIARCADEEAKEYMGSTPIGAEKLQEIKKLVEINYMCGIFSWPRGKRVFDV